MFSTEIPSVPSENKFSRIYYFVYVKEYFLDLFYRKTKTLQFELKICKNCPLQVVPNSYINSAKKKDFIFVYVKILVLFRVVQ